MDTRSTPRIAVQLKAQIDINNNPDQSIKLADGAHFDAAAFDISSGGLGVFTKSFLPRGAAIDISLEGAPFGLEGTMKIKGEVTYCNYVAPHKHKCGIKFLNMPAETRKAIDAFIAKYERRKEPRVDLPTEPDK